MKSTFNVTAKDLLHSLGSCLEHLDVCMEKPETLFRQKTFLLNRYGVNLIPFRVFCQLEEPTNRYDRIIKSSPLLISLSNHRLEKFLDFKR